LDISDSSSLLYLLYPIKKNVEDECCKGFLNDCNGFLNFILKYVYSKVMDGVRVKINVFDPYVYAALDT